uniref:O-antigen ligase family protein n=1 Tax=Alistipes sp. TaxID=1872444 RepID=UPI0040563F72
MNTDISKKERPSYISWGYAWGIKNFINGGLAFYPWQTIAYGAKFTILPLLLDYFRTIKKKETLFNIGLLFSQYFVLANIPFLTGIIVETGTATEYDGELSFVGIFTGQHPTAIVAAMASVFLLHAVSDTNKEKKYRAYNLIILLIDYYILYAAYTRTGWAMGVIGFIIFFYFRKQQTVKRTLSLIIVCLLLGVGYTWLLNNNERFYNRINDVINDGSYEADMGSGRMIYADVSLQLFKDSNTITQIFGTGIDPLMDNMHRAISMRIYSHNGWIDALTGNGVIGLFLMVMMCLMMIVYVWQHRKNKYAKISLACVVMYISYQFTQGGVFFYQDVLLAIGLVLCTNDNYHMKYYN